MGIGGTGRHINSEASDTRLASPVQEATTRRFLSIFHEKTAA